MYFRGAFVYCQSALFYFQSNESTRHDERMKATEVHQLRIQVMNAFRRGHNEDQKKYRQLKRYWKLLLKNEKDLTYAVYKPFGLFEQTTDRTVVDTLLSYDERLQVNYTLYQSLLTP